MSENVVTKLSITCQSFLNSDGNICKVVSRWGGSIHWKQLNTGKTYSSSEINFEGLVRKGSYYPLDDIGELLYA